MRKIVILGAGGFIGKNIIRKLSKDKDNYILAMDIDGKRLDYFNNPIYKNVKTYTMNFNDVHSYEDMLEGQDYLFHLISTTVPSTSNIHIPTEFRENVTNTIYLLDACVNYKIGCVIFMSSGGTVYGKEYSCPLNEDLAPKPINSYGIQKVTIEHLLYLYKCQYNLNYKIVRLSNPYGPFQSTNGLQGVVSNFIYRALHDQDLIIFGDGSVIRDYIYIDDAVEAILNIAFKENKYDIYNVGSGKGVSINHIVDLIKKVVLTKSKVVYYDGRSVDVPCNFLNIDRYESVFGKNSFVSLCDGIKKTAEHISVNDNI